MWCVKKLELVPRLDGGRISPERGSVGPSPRQQCRRGAIRACYLQRRLTRRVPSFKVNWDARSAVAGHRADTPVFQGGSLKSAREETKCLSGECWSNSHLRQVFDHRIDDEADVLGSIHKRSQLINLQHKHPGGSVADRLESMNKALPFMKETLGMIEAYNTIVHDESA